LASRGLKAMSPMPRNGIWSVSGAQSGLAAVALVVPQTPPSTVATKTRSALVGSTATA
jgi:hypothetical protein